MMFIVIQVGDPAFEAAQVWSGGVGVHHSVYKLVETHYLKGVPSENARLGR